MSDKSRIFVPSRVVIFSRSYQNMAPLLDIQHLTKRFGALELFQDINFSIHEGQKVGLIARNGTGKSTLLSILSGKEDYEEGAIIARRDARIAILEQSPAFPAGATVIDACFQRAGRLSSLISAYETCLATPGNPGLSELIDEMERQEAWDFELRAKQILSKLHITSFLQPVDELSGGQIKRVALANVLLAEPDLLILDEPTNHLDLEMIEWLENYLKRTTKALLMVTHDRYFLDNVCDSILELDDESLYSYSGNYAYYLEKRAARVAATNANIARAANLYRKELDWMRRMPCARGTKAKYRKEAFYELEQRARQKREERAARLEVKSGYIGSKIFEAEYVSKSFPLPPSEDGKAGEKIILKDFYYNFSRYEKMGIVGGNGTGKSTFIKLLLGLESPDSGRFVIGETVNFGYFSQEGMTFDEKDKVIDAVRRHAEVIDLGGGRHLTAMQFLTHFLFPPARQQDYIYKLSGGERRRLQLCIVLLKNPNFLVLDEPTNDLDIATLRVLEEYLQDFKGCVIVVSHDRYFMDKVVDHLLVFNGEGKIDDFPGNYSEYRTWKDLREREEKVDRELQSKSEPSEKTRNWGGEKRRRLTFKERQELTALEARIDTLESEIKRLETALCTGGLEVEVLTEYSKQLPTLSAELDEVSMRWMELSEIEG